MSDQVTNPAQTITEPEAPKEAASTPASATTPEAPKAQEETKPVSAAVVEANLKGAENAVSSPLPQKALKAITHEWKIGRFRPASVAPIGAACYIKILKATGQAIIYVGNSAILVPVSDVENFTLNETSPAGPDEIPKLDQRFPS